MRRGLIRGARPGARRVAVLAASAGGAIAVAIFFAGMFGGVDEADRYGRIPMPGRGTVELPKGDVALYYEERVTLPSDTSLDVRDGLVVTARRERTIRSKKTIPNSISLDGRALREFAKLEIPQAGRYRVRARADTGSSNSSAVTFGEGQLEGLGRSGIRSGLAFGAGLLVALAALALARRDDEPGASPAGAGIPAMASPPVPLSPTPLPAPVPATAPAAPASGGSVEQQLRDLQELQRSGALTTEEYDRLKKQVLEASY